MWGLRHATLITPAAAVADGAVLVDGSTIAWAGPWAERPAALRATDAVTWHDADGLLVTPGFIDLQVNGGFGRDFTADADAVWPVAAGLPCYGITAFLPTVITAPPERVTAARAALRRAPAGWRGAQPLGLHVEGPFLNPSRKGAHNPAHLRLPDAAAVADWTPAGGVRLVTLAPELPGAAAVIARLVANGVVVSAGHSAATVAEAQAALAAGVRYGTHLFNAMPPLHHREPGLAGALLADDRAVIGLIPDGVHVHPALVRTVWRAAAGRINVVTDCMAALGMAPGTYALGDRAVTVDAERAWLPDGTLAGSIVTLDAALRNVLAWTGCDSAEAVRSVTTIPADLLGDPTRGRLAPGCRADLVVLDADWRVRRTFVGGELVYAADAAAADAD